MAAYCQIVSYPMEYELRGPDVKGMKTLVVLTLSRYDKEGLEKVEELKQVFPEIPILIIAENPKQTDMLRAWRSGVTELILTPYQSRELISTIKEMLRLKQLVEASLQKRVQEFFRKAKAFFKSRFTRSQHSKNQPPAHVLSIASLIQPQFRTTEVHSKEYDLGVQFFGDLEIFIRGRKIPKIAGRKNASILAYLLYHHRNPVRKETVMVEFWPERPESSARNSLNVAIHYIRKHLQQFLPEQEIILFENDCYIINPELDISIDVDRFRSYWKKGRTIDLSQGPESALRAYNKALAIYRRDFLDKMLYEEWCESHRDNIKETYLFILNRLSSFFFQSGEYDACINICKKMLEKDACLEDAHRRLMECYHYLGLDDLARNQYFKCVRVLKEELEGTPSDQTKILFESIQHGRIYQPNE